jgi:hypothetical protein
MTALDRVAVSVPAPMTRRRAGPPGHHNPDMSEQ